MRMGMKKVAMVVAASAVLLVSPAPPAQAASGVFSLLCDFSHELMDDPIMFPGQPGASHLHQFSGNVTTNAGSTYEAMLGQPTSCPYSKDTAAYWVPALVSPSGAPLAPVRMSAYYRNKPSNGQLVVAFPPDLRLIAGYPTVATGTKGRLGWNCKDSHPYLASPPDCRGIRTKGVKAHVVFPNCWNGSVDSDDHRSHVVYPSGSECPTSHPLKLPKLSLHVTWPVKDARGYWLSSDSSPDTAAGTTLHADLWNTWDQTELERLTEVCLNGQLSCKNLRDP
jgi:Domain of unknown function (DUF1996)